MDSDGFIDYQRIGEVMERGHIAYHSLPEPGPDEETVLFALHQRDLILIGLALPVMEAVFIEQGIGCFHDGSKELQTRLMEVVRVQTPHWTAGGDIDNESGEAGEGRSE